MATDSFFGGKARPFQEEFPGVATFRAVLKRTDFPNLAEESFDLDMGNVSENFKCPNPKCRGDVQGRGGVHIEGPIREMVRAKESHRRFTHKCQHPCLAMWDIT